MFGCDGTYTIEGNTLYSPGNIYNGNVNAIKLPSSDQGDITVRNNIMYDISTTNNLGDCIIGGIDGSHKVYNNLCTGYHFRGFTVDSWDSAEIYNNTIDGGIDSNAIAINVIDSSGNGSTSTIKNNILGQGAGQFDFQVSGATTTVTGDNNILINDASVNETSSGTYTAGGSDLFATNPTFRTNSFFIESGSPAINAGENQTLFTNDIRGVEREGTYDIGAYESKTFVGIGSGLIANELTIN